MLEIIVDFYSVEDLIIFGVFGLLWVWSYCLSVDMCLVMVVFFYGGGFVIGDLDIYDNICWELVCGVNVVVVLVDY